MLNMKTKAVQNNSIFNREQEPSARSCISWRGY